MLKLYETAINARKALRYAIITYDQALVAIKPYLEKVNEKAGELARKNGTKMRRCNAQGFLR